MEAGEIVGRAREGGFTLLEILVVVAIIGILGALAVTDLRGAQLVTRMSGVARNLSAELSQMRVRAVATGAQMVLCIQPPSNNPADLFGKDTPKLTEFTPTSPPTPPTSPLGVNDVLQGTARVTSTTDFASLGGSLVGISSTSGSLPATGSLVVAFDYTGAPSVWQSSSSGCNDSSMAQQTLGPTTPYTIVLAISGAKPTDPTRTIQINADGTVSLP